MRMHRAVADRINIRVAGAARRIDDNPVVNAEPGSFREFYVGNETDADQHKIGGKRLTAGACDRAHTAILAPGGETADRDPCANVDSGFAMDAFIEFRQIGRRDAREHARRPFEHGYGKPAFNRDGGGFKPNIAAADDHETPGASMSGCNASTSEIVRR